jgi:hypothetical protein
MRLSKEGGRGLVEERTSRMSQWMFFARSSGVEREVGRMIHRITRDTTSGFSVEE